MGEIEDKFRKMVVEKINRFSLIKRNRIVLPEELIKYFPEWHISERTINELYVILGRIPNDTLYYASEEDTDCLLIPVPVQISSENIFFKPTESWPTKQRPFPRHYWILLILEDLKREKILNRKNHSNLWSHLREKYTIENHNIVSQLNKLWGDLFSYTYACVTALTVKKIQIVQPGELLTSKSKNADGHQCLCIIDNELRVATALLPLEDLANFSDERYIFNPVLYFR